MKMAEKGKAAVYHGLGKPMEIQEFPVPDPEPGAIVIKLTRANLCGSDLHMWRGDLDLGALGAPLPVILGHEMTGRVARLGEGVSSLPAIPHAHFCVEDQTHSIVRRTGKAPHGGSQRRHLGLLFGLGFLIDWRHSGYRITVQGRVLSRVNPVVQGLIPVGISQDTFFPGILNKLVISLFRSHPLEQTLLELSGIEDRV